MASTATLPTTTTAHSHSHSHSHGHSHHPPEPSPCASSASTGASPAKEQGHRQYRADMNGNGQLHGAVRSPYAEYSDRAHHHSHSYGHDRVPSNDSTATYTLKPFSNGGATGRLRGDADLGRPSPRKAATKYGFSPIHETAPAPPPAPPSSSWLELPEALTALLIPLPYFLASLAFPPAIRRPSKLPSTLSEAVAESAPVVEPLGTAGGAPLLHALMLSSATLLLVGVAAKISSSLQPLDRRKEQKGTFVLNKAPKTIIRSVSGILLPFYASLRLGGSKTALGLLVAVAADLGQRAEHATWGSLLQTLKTRKVTVGALLSAVTADAMTSGDTMSTMLGHGALLSSILLAPLPLPTMGRSPTGSTEDSYMNQVPSRESSQRQASSLVDSFESTLLTIVSALILAVISVLYYLANSSLSSVSVHTAGLSLLCIASAAALVFISLPSALRSHRQTGLKLGALFIAGFSFWEYYHSSLACIIFLWACALLVGAAIFDTRSPAPSAHSHGHSHSDHKHAHHHGHDHDHHLHGNHSRLSAFLIACATPGSIIHSVLIEKDSRRIAYFGVLNLGFMLVQFFYGFATGSLGLLTDSIHMLFDCAGLAVGLAAAVMSKWRPNVRFPYGYGKIDTLSGFANGVFLLLVSVEIIFDAFERLWEGHELQRLNELLVVSILGFLVNIVGLTAFGHAHHGHGGHDHGDHDHGHGHSHDNENMQGIFLHILADALGSVAVIISTLLTKYYGWSGWDPIASCIIAILIFLSAIPLVRSSGARLMLSLPNDLEYKIRNALGELSGLRGVVGYAVPKFWMEDEGAAHAEAHAKDDGSGDGHDHGHDHDHNHDHSHEHSHDHNQNNHAHDHSHDHSHSHSAHTHTHTPSTQRVLGVIHIIASRAADLEDVRERTVQFLKGKGMHIIVHVEHEGQARCWCGGGTKQN